MSSKPDTLPPPVREAVDKARTDRTPLALVLRLRGGPGSLVPPPEAMSRLVGDLIQRAAASCAGRVTRHNIFANLGTFVVEGDAEFLETLACQPEIAHAAINRGAETFVTPVQPVRRQEPSDGDWAGE